MRQITPTLMLFSKGDGKQHFFKGVIFLYTYGMGISCIVLVAPVQISVCNYLAIPVTARADRSNPSEYHFCEEQL
jgi:hypothetical protein